jgi:hypothetical protein
MIAQDKQCRISLWRRSQSTWKRETRVTLPTGQSAASADSLWVVGDTAGVVIGTSGAVRNQVKSPCARPFTTSFVAVWSTSRATVFCTGESRAAGQIRLVYGTTNAGKTWSELAGARTVGTKSGGRHDGLDGDGRLVSVGSLNAPGTVAAVLSGVTCPGLQLRLSKDSGRNWTTAGCLPAGLARSPLAVGGSTARMVLGGSVDGKPAEYASTDGGRHWTTA